MVGNDGESLAAREEEMDGIERFGGETYDADTTHD
jgi:hypothetical protein